MLRIKKASSAICLIFAILISCVSGCVSSGETEDTVQHGEVTITDSLGNEVSLSSPAERIVVINSNAAEMLIAIGAADTVVGLTDTGLQDELFSSRLPNAVDIGDWKTPNVETLVELDPDVIICYSNFKPKNIDQILAANMTVIYMDCYKLHTLASDARMLGKLTGCTGKAEEYAKFHEKYIDMVCDRIKCISDNEKPEIYFETMTEYTAAYNESGGDTLVKTAGGKNIAGELSSSNKKVSSEWIIAEDPSIIIKSRKIYNITESDVELKVLRDEIIGRAGMPEVSAVKEGRVYVIQDDVAFGPRGSVGLMYVAKMIHPDLFKDIDPSSVNKEYAEKFLPGAAEGCFVYPVPG